MCQQECTVAQGVELISLFCLLATRVCRMQVSEPRGPWWELLVQAIQETATVDRIPGLPQDGHIPVVPGMLTGGTDSKHLGPLADSVFRFSPIPIDRTKGDLKLVHGIDERLPTESFLSAMRVYLRAITLMGGPVQSN